MAWGKFRPRSTVTMWLNVIQNVRIAGKDQGINIRHKVTDMIDFIQDDDRLREERKKAKKNKDKYVGMSSSAMGGYGGSSGWGSDSSWQDNWPRGGGGGGSYDELI